MKLKRSLSPLVLLLSAGIAFFLSPAAVAEMEALHEDTMSEITGEGGLGVRLNLRFNVSDSWGNPNDDGGGNGNGRFEVEDDDGYFDEGDDTFHGTGFLVFNEIYGTIDSNNNVIHVDANPDFVELSAPNAFTGINLTINEIMVTDSQNDSFGDDLAAITIADDGTGTGSGDGDHVDSDATFDLHNTTLELY